jgi:hypothetical protein
MATNSLAYNKQFDLPQRSTDDEEYIKTLEYQLEWYANELTRLDDEINFYRSKSEELAELGNSRF